MSLDDTMPYGFIGKYQTIKCKNNVPETCEQIFNVILNKPIGDKLKNFLIYSLGQSENYLTSIILGKKLESCEPFTKQQINEILYWFLMNDQVSGATPVINFIRPLIEKNKGIINPLLLKIFRDFKNNNWYPTHRINGHEVLLTKILKEHPSLSMEALSTLIEDERERNSASTFEIIYQKMKEQGISFSINSIWKSRTRDQYIDMNNLANQNLTLDEKIHALLTVAGGQSINEISRRTGVEAGFVEEKVQEMLEQGEILENTRGESRIFVVS